MSDRELGDITIDDPPGEEGRKLERRADIDDMLARAIEARGKWVSATFPSLEAARKAYYTLHMRRRSARKRGDPDYVITERINKVYVRYSEDD